MDDRISNIQPSSSASWLSGLPVLGKDTKAIEKRFPGLPQSENGADQKSAEKSGPGASKNSAASSPGAQRPMTKDEQSDVDELKNIDRNVRAHEAAHMAAGAGLVKGGATYSYRTGPDGVRYAVGGEVSIDMSTEKKPEATIAKMERIKAAALAPSDPSPQDRSVAAEASSIEAEARKQEVSQKQQAAKAPVNVYAHAMAKKAYGQKVVSSGVNLENTYA